MSFTQLRKRIAVGCDNFGSLIRKDLLFVDKTLFIKEFLDNKGTKVTLIMRPRRFGKTLNLSMLHHFFAAEVANQPTKDLFTGLKISQAGEKYMAHQGQYSVIFLSFKSVDGASYEIAIEQLKNLMRNLYNNSGLLIKEHLTDYQKLYFNSIIQKTANETDLKGALFTLIKFLYQYYNKKIMVFIDECDTPLQAGYINDYYVDIVDFMRSLLGNALKSNIYLDRALLTGIMRISKESIFSGLNNLKIYSIFNDCYGEYFGFTEEEVNDSATKVGLVDKLPSMKEWYNGYQIGGVTLYNPWSIMNCLQEGGTLACYWVNTSGNQIIKDLLMKSNLEVKKVLQTLLEGGSIQRVVYEDLVFDDLKKNKNLIWTFFLLTGYLKLIDFRREKTKIHSTLAIPNEEVQGLYCEFIEEWFFQEDKDSESYNNFVNNLSIGDVEKFKISLKDFMLRVVSFYDFSHEPESFYHGLMLGFLAALNKNLYEIKSNQESGDGRYDIAIFPKDASKLGILIELKQLNLRTVKRVKKADLMRSLTKEAKKALVQINQSNYHLEFEQRSVSQVLKIGLAFKGKNFHLVSE